MKLKRIFISCLFSMIIILSGVISINYLNLYFNPKEIVAMVNETTTKSTTIKTSINLAEKKGEVEDYYISLANEQLSLLPDSIITKFIENEWHLYVTDEDISEVYLNNLYPRVQGLTKTSEHIIYIEARYDAITESVNHEIGHFIDYLYGSLSNEEEFRDNIYNDELESFKSKIYNPSCVTNEKEFFAEEFYYYFKDSSKCTPKAYAFIENLINNI